jgi:transposase
MVGRDWSLLAFLFRRKVAGAFTIGAGGPMVHLEEWMEIRELHRLGVSQSEIARRLGVDRKTVRKYLQAPPEIYGPRATRPGKVEPYSRYLRERWEQGVRNAHKLFLEIVPRGYTGRERQVRAWVAPWRAEERERAFVRFETAPGEQSQLDWGHFGNFLSHRLYLFVLTLCYSRMRYIEFTQRQDIETLLACMIHAFRYFGGVTATVLVDNMKTAVLGREVGVVRWNPKFLDFASYYGFLPRACHPYRPETKGKVERTVGFVRQSFWQGLDLASLGSLETLNQRARTWMEEVNLRVHGTTREIPAERFFREQLRALANQPDYDTSYVSYREVCKDCLVSYRGSRYSVPHRYAGQRVVVKEPVEGGRIAIWHQQERMAEHVLAETKGAMIIDPQHYQGLQRRPRVAEKKAAVPARELVAGPGVGRHFAVPEVEVRPLTAYEIATEVSHVAAI